MRQRIARSISEFFGGECAKNSKKNLSDFHKKILAALILMLVKAPFLSKAVTERPAPLHGANRCCGGIRLRVPGGYPLQGGLPDLDLRFQDL